MMTEEMIEQQSHSSCYRILVADDEPDIHVFFRQALSPPTAFDADLAEMAALESRLFDAGDLPSPYQPISFDLSIASQAEEAVEKVRAAVEEGLPFSVAFLDVRMPPGKDGVWAAMQIRALDPHVEMIVATAFSNVSPEEISRRIGSPEKLLYVQKPFHLHEIRQFALAQSAKWQAQRDLRQIREQLQELVTARTIELAQANRALKNRIRQNLRLEQEIAQISNDLMQRVGRDLHDGLGQQLTGIMLMAKALAKQLESRGLPEAATAREIPHLVGDAIKATRSLARGLCPIGLDTAGLGPALRTLCADTEAMTGVACHLEWNEGVNIVDLLAAANLYYLTQEAIANAIRHGEPSQIVVRLTREHGSLVLSIRDDGKGFDPAAANGGGLGLGIMRHRAEAIGGSFEIQSRPGGGAIVRCIAPMPNECRGERG